MEIATKSLGLDEAAVQDVLFMCGLISTTGTPVTLFQQLCMQEFYGKEVVELLDHTGLTSIHDGIVSAHQMVQACARNLTDGHRAEVNAWTLGRAIVAAGNTAQLSVSTTAAAFLAHANNSSWAPPHECFVLAARHAERTN